MTKLTQYKTLCLTTAVLGLGIANITTEAIAWPSTCPTGQELVDAAQQGTFNFAGQSFRGTAPLKEVMVGDNKMLLQIWDGDASRVDKADSTTGGLSDKDGMCAYSLYQGKKYVGHVMLLYPFS